MSEIRDKKGEHYTKRNGEEYHNIDSPELSVFGITVKSHAHLVALIDKICPGIRHTMCFERWMELSCKDFKLLGKIEGRKFLAYGELSKLSREFDINYTTVQDRVLKAVPPKIISVLRDAISVPDARKKLNGIKSAIDGIEDIGEIDRRIDNYYAGREYRESANYDKDHEMAKKYFLFMEQIAQGGLLTDIARLVGVSHSTVRRWYNSTIPWMIQLASAIPSEKPIEGYVWLPLKTGPKNNPSNFIQVPLRIQSHREIEDVVSPLRPLEGELTKSMRRRFGPTTPIDSFMYALGSILSDGSIRLREGTNIRSSSFGMGLGQEYDWSLDYGDGTCYHLRMLGIDAHRNQDSDSRESTRSYPSSGSHHWESEATPFLTWIRETCLGLESSESKTYDSVSADWILDSPLDWRVAFLQGICDGDGCASLASQYVSIATTSNTEFFQKLLSTFEVESHVGDGAIVVSAHNSIARLAELDMFRYAADRKQNLHKLKIMMKTWDHSRQMTEDELRRIHILRKDGMSWGNISETIFDEFGHGWPYYTISRWARKEYPNLK
ncbi:MAG: hypothetical protein KGY80_03435 [Candidatus Thorarchaeota archaeon]|nr:hypothetical protein [Candidatus Thorarchaeota archaeon]